MQFENSTWNSSSYSLGELDSSLFFPIGIPSTSQIFFGVILSLDPLGNVIFIVFVSKFFTTKYGNFPDPLVVVLEDLVFVLFLFFTSSSAAFSCISGVSVGFGFSILKRLAAEAFVLRVGVFSDVGVVSFVGDMISVSF
ncbi:hypothetical protein Tco_1315359 [Tanacetum coccineum]